MKLTRKVVVVCVFAWVSLSWGANPQLNYFTEETEHFVVYFPEQLSHFVPKVKSLAEDSHRTLSPWFEWTPTSKTNLVLVDDFDDANGFAMPMPRNTIHLFMQPPTEGELLAFDDWLKLLIHHEYTHTLHMDKVLGTPSILRSIFGRFVLLFPNALHPNWFQEGLATYAETDDENLIGRGQSDFYQIMMRAEVESGLKPVSRINVVNPHDWPLNTAYLYGVYFFRFMHDVHGEASIQRLVKNYSNNLLPYRVSSNPATVTGKNLEQLWRDFDQYLRGYFAPQIQRIQSNPESEFAVLSNNRFSYGDPDIDEEGAIWITATDTHLGSQLLRLASGEQKVVAELNSRGQLDASVEHGVLIAQRQVCDEFGVYYGLYTWKDDALTPLTECSRYRKGQWLSNGDIVALRYEAGVPYIDHLTQAGDKKATIWMGQPHDIISDFDVNDQEMIVASIKQGEKPWQIALLTSLQSDQWRPITSGYGIKLSPRWYGEGVDFTLIENGQMESIRWNANTGKSVRRSHTYTGLKGSISNGDELVGLRYGADGFQLVSVKAGEYPNLYEDQPSQEWQPHVIPSKYYDQKTRDSYHPLRTLAPTYWFPIWQSNDELSEVGFMTSGNDVLLNHQYVAQLTYEKTTGSPLVNGSYIYANRWLMGVNQSIVETSLTLAGSEPVFKQSTQWITGYIHPITKIKNSWYPYAVYGQEEVFFRTERQDRVSNTAHNGWVGFGVLYDGLNQSHWAADATQGWQWSTTLETADLAENDFDDGHVFIGNLRQYHTFDNHHTLANRVLMGLNVSGDSVFQLGGTASEVYIGPGVSVNKRDYPLRGFDDADASLLGKNALMHSVEYRLPFSWSDHTLMVPPVGMSGWSIRAFMDNGVTWNEDISKENVHTGLGAELILDTNVFYYLNLKLRVGLASGVTKGGKDVGYVEVGGAF